MASVDPCDEGFFVFGEIEALDLVWINAIQTDFDLTPRSQRNDVELAKVVGETKQLFIVVQFELLGPAESLVWQERFDFLRNSLEIDLQQAELVSPGANFIPVVLAGFAVVENAQATDAEVRDEILVVTQVAWLAILAHDHQIICLNALPSALEKNPRVTVSHGLLDAPGIHGGRRCLTGNGFYCLARSQYHGYEDSTNDG